MKKLFVILFSVLSLGLCSAAQNDYVYIVNGIKPAGSIMFGAGMPFLNKEAKEMVRDIADFLKDNPDMKVKLEGYADKGAGLSSLNFKLSRKRAEKVAKAIAGYGIPYSRIIISYFGDGGKISGIPAENRTVNYVIE